MELATWSHKPCLLQPLLCPNSGPQTSSDSLLLTEQVPLSEACTHLASLSPSPIHQESWRRFVWAGTWGTLTSYYVCTAPKKPSSFSRLPAVPTAKPPPCTGVLLLEPLYSGLSLV